MTKADIAKKLSVSVEDVDEAILQGHIPKPLKIGNLTRWREDDIEFLCSNLLSCDDIAQILNTTPEDIEQLMQKNLIPTPIRIGNLVRWNPDKIRDWVNSLRPSCTEPTITTVTGTDVNTMPTDCSLDDVEKKHIQNVLTMTDGNRSETAKIIGIGERTLYRKIKEYKLGYPC